MELLHMVMENCLVSVLVLRDFRDPDLSFFSFEPSLACSLKAESILAIHIVTVGEDDTQIPRLKPGFKLRCPELESRWNLIILSLYLPCLSCLQ